MCRPSGGDQRPRPGLAGAVGGNSAVAGAVVPRLRRTTSWPGLEPDPRGPGRRSVQEMASRSLRCDDHVWRSVPGVETGSPRSRAVSSSAVSALRKQAAGAAARPASSTRPSTPEAGQLPGWHWARAAARRRGSANCGPPSPATRTRLPVPRQRQGGGQPANNPRPRSGCPARIARLPRSEGKARHRLSGGARGGFVPPGASRAVGGYNGAVSYEARGNRTGERHPGWRVQASRAAWRRGRAGRQWSGGHVSVPVTPGGPRRPG